MHVLRQTPREATNPYAKVNQMVPQGGLKYHVIRGVVRKELVFDVGANHIGPKIATREQTYLVMQSMNESD